MAPACLFIITFILSNNVRDQWSSLRRGLQTWNARTWSWTSSRSYASSWWKLGSCYVRCCHCRYRSIRVCYHVSRGRKVMWQRSTSSWADRIWSTTQPTATSCGRSRQSCSRCWGSMLMTIAFPFLLQFLLTSIATLKFILF